MLEMFEKLINEHGSSAILRERIELINDKYEALEEKLKNSVKEKELLEKENQLLKDRLATLEAELESNNRSSDELPEGQQDLLMYLYKKNDRVREEVIASELAMDKSELAYHIDELREKGFLNHPGVVSGSPLTGTRGYLEQSISKLGRKYVVENLST